MAIVQPVIEPRTSDARELQRFYEIVARRLSYQTYAGDPTDNATPRWIGDMCHDTTNSAWYKSTGTASADWLKITP